MSIVYFVLLIRLCFFKDSIMVDEIEENIYKFVVRCFWDLSYGLWEYVVFFFYNLLLFGFYN